MTSDPVREETQEAKTVLAAIVVSLAYAHGDLPAEDYAALERARAVLAAYLPQAVRILA